MSTQTISIKANVPTDAFTNLKNILEEIKEALKDMVKPLKDIRDTLSATIKPEVDTSGLEIASTVLEGFVAILSVIGGLLVVLGFGEAAAIVGLIGACYGVIAWLLELDWNAIGESLSGFFGMIGEGFLSICDTIGEIFGPFFTETLPGFFTETIPWLIETIVTFFAELPGKIGEAIAGFANTISEWVSNGVSWVSESVPKVIDAIIGFFSDIAFKIGEALGKFAGTIAAWGTNAINWISETVPEVIASVVDFFYELPGKIGNAIAGFADTISTWVSNAISWISEQVPQVIDKVIEFFSGIPQKIADALGGIKEKIVDWGSDCIEWFTTELPKVINNVIDWFSKIPDALADIGKNMIKGLWNGIVSVGDWLYDRLEQIFGGLWDVVSGFFSGFGQGFEASYDPVPQYATGGFPVQGQMFLARETGPELVGTIGSRSAVVNNEQIVESVSQGVYNAVRAALSAGNSSGSNPLHVNLYLDGKQIASAVEKVQRERGLSLIGAAY